MKKILKLKPGSADWYRERAKQVRNHGKTVSQYNHFIGIAEAIEIHCSICGHSHDCTVCPNCHGMHIPTDDWKDKRISQLERELAAVTADLEFRRELGTLQQQEYDKVTAERDALKSVVEKVTELMGGLITHLKAMKGEQ